ncbi:MAG TPA: signal recognition particle-docking protein FtsY [Candidatus Lokiarchaeia archaeon]|nr:signal recognition particle-docking protein FtsY [Candidatus Lokiarchaeia archaeon]
MFSKLKQGLKNVAQKISTKELTQEKLDKILQDLKIELIKNDVAVFAAEKVTELVSEDLAGERVGRTTNTKNLLLESIRAAILQILHTDEKIDLLEMAQQKRDAGEPLIICFLGVNGTGKTTTIAKVAKLFKDNGFIPVAAASDTFRAGAIEQLSKHMASVGVEMIKHDYKADAASVAYDTIEHARAKHRNVVLIDTAGRQVTDKNLMNELAKIVRVNEPDLVLFIGDSLAGNDVLTQAEEFSKHVRVDATILTKVDADSKGGAALSVAYITKKPIIYVGVGQKYEDLIPFDPEWFVNKIIGSNN